MIVKSFRITLWASAHKPLFVPEIGWDLVTAHMIWEKEQIRIEIRAVLLGLGL